MSPEDRRFWARVDKTGDCWVWTGETNNHGYGRFATWVGGRVRHLAHRYALRSAGIELAAVDAERIDEPSLLDGLDAEVLA